MEREGIVGTYSNRASRAGDGALVRFYCEIRHVFNRQVPARTLKDAVIDVENDE